MASVGTMAHFPTAAAHCLTGAGHCLTGAAHYPTVEATPVCRLGSIGLMAARRPRFPKEALTVPCPADRLSRGGTNGLVLRSRSTGYFPLDALPATSLLLTADNCMSSNLATPVAPKSPIRTIAIFADSGTRTFFESVRQPIDPVIGPK